MNEITITQELEAKLPDSSLVVQVFLAVPYVQVVINRSQLPPDYPVLSSQIADILGQMDLPDMQYVAVYGRVYGQEEMEYEASLELVKTPAVTPSPAQTLSENPFLTPSTSPEAASFNLANYCFTRNAALLTSALPSPKMPIAELIRDFDGFSDPHKQMILEQLSVFFRNPDGVNTRNWTEEMRVWLGRIRKFSDEETRSLAIWVSRYCAHPEKTLNNVQEVFQSAKEAAQERARMEREERQAERESRTTSGGRSQQPAPTRTERVTHARTTVAPPRRRSPAAKVFALVGLAAATVASTWFFRGFTLAMGWFGTILFIFGFLGGWFAGLTNTKEGLIIGRMSTAALITYLILGIILLPIAIIIYFLLALFLGFLVIPYVSAIAGGIVGALGRWFLHGFGENDEAEGVKYGRFFGLSNGLFWLTIIAHFAAILLGGIPGLGGSNLDGFATKNLFQNKKIEGFSSATCEQLMQRTENERFTIQNAIDLLGVGASSIESEVRAGRPGYFWDYENAKVVLLTDDISNSAVVDVVAVCMVCEQKGSVTSCSGRNLLGD